MRIGARAVKFQSGMMGMHRSLKAGQFKDAVSAYKNDMQRWPENCVLCVRIGVRYLQIMKHQKRRFL